MVIATLLLTALGALPAPQEEPSDKALEKTWARLSEGERAEAIEWLRFECSELDTRQLRLARALIAASPADAGALPEAGEASVYDPAEHGGSSRKRRERLKPGSSRARSALKKFKPEGDPRGEDAAWSYDWARGGVVRSGDPEDPERVFRNALRGIAPDLDLARALCVRALDRGEQRAAMRAFGHAYVDRGGSAYPGLTLYDVWSSGEKMEVPDADALGIVHDVLDEWSRWTSPISSRGQRELYGAIEELFQTAHRYRELRESLADVYLLGDPAPVAGYGGVHANLHGLWLEHGESPEALAARLPGPDGWLAFMEELAARAPGSSEAAVLRRAELGGDGRRIRTLLVRVLQGMVPDER